MFRAIVSALLKAHGKPKRPPPKTLFAWILWENAAYLVDDERRRAVYDALAKQIGLRPQEILAAKKRDLIAAIEAGGMRPEQRADKLIEAAELAVELDVERLKKAPVADAKKQLKKFPGIGNPGAEKLLLLAADQPFLAPESNGLRVLNRLGFGEESKSYDRSYRSALEAVAPELGDDARWLADAHQLLRIHGQEICKRMRPACDACVVAKKCRYAASRRAT